MKWTNEIWPENGRGVWCIAEFHNLDSRNESWLLRKVMAYDPAQPIGQEIEVFRDQYERGGIDIWRGGPDLVDPKFSMIAK